MNKLLAKLKSPLSDNETLTTFSFWLGCGAVLLLFVLALIIVVKSGLPPG